MPIVSFRLSQVVRWAVRMHYGGNLFMATLRQPVSCLLGTVTSTADLRSLFRWVLLLFSLLLTACTSEDQSVGSSADAPKIETVGPRWYTADGISRGASIFARLCAELDLRAECANGMVPGVRRTVEWRRRVLAVGSPLSPGEASLSFFAVAIGA